MRVSTALTTALSLVLCACGSGVKYIGDAQGPGRVAGQVVFEEPGFELRYDSAAEPAPDATAHLLIPLEFGLILPGQTEDTRSLYRELWKQGSSDYQVWLDYAGDGRYVYPFDFTDVPLAHYILGYHHLNGGDWDIPTTLTYDTQQEITLSHLHPEELGVESTVPGIGNGNGGSVNGKLLVSGNPVSSTLAPGLYHPGVQPTYPAEDGPMPVQTQLLATAEPSLYGRYFYTLSDLAPGDYEAFYWSSIPAQFKTSFWDDSDSDQDNSHSHPAAFSIHSGEQQAGVDAYANRLWYQEWPDGGSNDQHSDQFGVLEVALRVPAGFDWSKDTLLLAESSGPDKNGNNAAYNYVVPEHFGADGVAHYRLAYLEAGEYEVSLRQLGASNSDPVAVIDTYEKRVTLPSGTPYPDFNWDGSDVPYAAIEFTVD